MGDLGGGRVPIEGVGQLGDLLARVVRIGSQFEGHTVVLFAADNTIEAVVDAAGTGPSDVGTGGVVSGEDEVGVGGEFDAALGIVEGAGDEPAGGAGFVFSLGTGLDYVAACVVDLVGLGAEAVNRVGDLAAVVVVGFSRCYRCGRGEGRLQGRVGGDRGRRRSKAQFILARFSGAAIIVVSGDGDQDDRVLYTVGIEPVLPNMGPLAVIVISVVGSESVGICCAL